MARDIASRPITLWLPPLCSTLPPAASTRAHSSCLLGLWSAVKARAVPPREMTARESPARHALKLSNCNAAHKWIMYSSGMNTR
jgi:hypothetical protein